MKPLTSHEMSELAKRLRNRADSKMMADQPEQANDLKQAARIIDEVVLGAHAAA